MNFNPYYYTQDFLDIIDKMKIRVQYAKIILLTFDEQPIKEIQGTITSGSLSINGASAVRRSINLSLSADKSIGNITDLENLISLNKKVRVEVGFDTPIQYIAKRGETITWFKQGIYVIASASISESVNGYSISLTGNDKMVMLNGVAGGTIPFTTILSEKDEITEDGQILTTDTNLFQIIQEVVTHFGKESLDNIIINDIIDTGKIYVKYIGNDTYHVYLDASGVPITGSVGTYQGTKGANWKEKTYQNGQVVGYFETDLTWPDSENNPLQAAAGETVTSVLDKIKNVLGNYEYFYDLDGRFVFQQIQNWVNTTSKSIEILTFDYTNYLRDYSKIPSKYTISDKEQIVSISQNPKYDNIKNDFVIIGSHNMANGLTKPIMYHVAIDKKPLINTQSLGIIEMKETTSEGTEKGKLKEVSLNKQRWICYSEDSEKWYDFQGKPIKNKAGAFLNKSDINNLIKFNVNSEVPPVKIIELPDTYQVREIKTEVNYGNNDKKRIITVTTKLYTASSSGTSSDYKDWDYEIENITEIIGEFVEIGSSYFQTRKIKTDEWREVMYQRAMIESQKNSRSSDYDEELLGFWRDVYNPGNPAWDKYEGYCTNLNNLTWLEKNEEGNFIEVTEVADYTSLVYWLDLLEPGAPLSSYSVSAIGRRTKTATDDKITSIYNQAPEDIVYCFNVSELQNSKNNNVFLLKQMWQPMFTETGVNESCFDRVRTLIYNHFTYNTAISLSMTPRFYMEPNTLIELDLEDIKGKFQVTQINLPLGYNGTMNLSLTETNQRG